MSAPADRPATAWRALTGNPIGLLRSSWPLRSLAYLLTSLPVGLAWLAAVSTLFTAAGVAGNTAAGAGGAFLAVLALLAALPLSAMPLAVVERRRLRWVDPVPALSQHRPVSAADPIHWLRTRLTETATWRELGYACLLALVFGWLDLVMAVGVVGLALALLLLPAWRLLLADRHDMPLGVSTATGSAAAALSGVVLCLVLPHLLTALAAGRAVPARALLGAPRKNVLQVQLMEVTQSRARLLNAFESERRQLERDLHDGVQQRLTALIMSLGLARLELADGPGTARDLVAKAQEEVRATLAELRELVRGIHPQVLSDRGLGAALTALAERSPVPVELDCSLSERPPATVESAAYFVVSEALANVAKHGRATDIRVSVGCERGRLIVEVRDDGIGGADPTRGSGLVGLADRVSALQGEFTVSSPPGGPTVLRAEIPCGS